MKSQTQEKNHPKDRPSSRSADAEELREFAELVQDAHGYEWIAFADARCVDEFFTVFFKLYDDAREIGGARLAAIGAVAADRLRAHHYHVDLTSRDAAALSKDFRGEQNVENVKILLVRPKNWAGTTGAELTKMGAIVDEALVPSC